MEGSVGGKVVSERLSEWLEHTGETTVGVAVGTNLSRTTVSNLLNAHIDRPRLHTVRRLASHFGVSVEEFLAGPKAVLPPGFDVVRIFREVVEEVGLDKPRELTERADERYARELEEHLGHLSREERRATLEAIEASLRGRSSRLDKSFHSPLWQDPEQYAAMDRLTEEIRAVQVTLHALDRVLAEA